MRKSLMERFWAKVQKGDECWAWQGAVNSAGYGHVAHPPGRTALAHRLSYEMHTGPIPEGLFVCHTCDNRRCVNPEHLFVGTNRDNALDMWEKGRGKTPHPWGETCRHGHRLTADNVYVWRNRRACLTCKRASEKRWYARRKLIGG